MNFVFILLLNCCFAFQFEVTFIVVLFRNICVRMFLHINLVLPFCFNFSFGINFYVQSCCELILFGVFMSNNDCTPNFSLNSKSCFLSIFFSNWISFQFLHGILILIFNLCLLELLSCFLIWLHFDMDFVLKYSCWFCIGINLVSDYCLKLRFEIIWCRILMSSKDFFIEFLSLLFHFLFFLAWNGCYALICLLNLYLKLIWCLNCFVIFDVRARFCL